MARPPRLYRTYGALLCALGAIPAFLTGCAPAPHSAVASARAIPVGLNAVALQPVSASAKVQALPQYSEARRACGIGQYRRAATILARLEQTRGFSDEERAFCRDQQQICLNHLSLYGSVRVATVAASQPAHQAASGPAASSHTGLTAPAQNSDCGPKALLIACNALGVKTTLPELTRAAGTSSRGTSLAGLKRAAEALRLKAVGIQVGRDALASVTVPAIAYVNGNHYITVVSLQGRGESGVATLQDPNQAQPINVTLEKLLQLSSGYLLTLRR